MQIRARLRSDHVTSYIRQSVGSDQSKRWPDGQNLYLVTRNGHGFWVLQYRDGDKIRSKGLGSAKIVTLAQARKLREDFVVRRRAGELPATRGVGKRFANAAEDYLKKHADEWSPKQQKDHATRLRLHASELDNRRVNRITVDEVADVLRPIWTGPNHGRGSKLRGLIELILNAEKVPQPGPAAWSRLKDELGKDNLVKVSHPALHYTDVPALLTELQADETMQARAIRFIILTGVRQQEALGATWAELHAKGEMMMSPDGVFRPLDGDTWIIPASRMKAGREHRVPMAAKTLALLGERGTDDTFIFPSGRSGSGQLSHNATYELLKTLRPSITLHGFRSTFADWAARHEYAKELRELALAHVVGDNVFQAYNRDPLVERRRPMMEQWAKFAMGSKGRR
jgi:integrase